MKIDLFDINDYDISTKTFDNWLSGSIVEEFENTIASFVGAKYACSFSSASSAIFLSMLNKNISVTIPSMIPPVVANMIMNSGNSIIFKDSVDWIGGSYTLHDFGKYKIIDSAQRLSENQFSDEANPNDLMLFSFYPTKPIGSFDGGMIVSDDLEKIKWFKAATQNGTTKEEKSWNRKIMFSGWKMYMNSMQAYVAMQNFKKYQIKLDRLSRIRDIYNTEFGYTNTSDHLYRVNVANRDSVIERFSDKKIEWGIHYKPLHQNAVYNPDVSLGIGLFLEKTEMCARTTLSIPFHEKMTDENIECVINEVKLNLYG